MQIPGNISSNIAPVQLAESTGGRPALALRLHDLLDAEVVDIRQGGVTLRVAGQLLNATLKAELAVGQQVKLLVRELTAAKVTLQVLQPNPQGPDQPLADVAVDQHLISIGVTPSVDAREAARALVKEGLPLTADNLLAVMRALSAGNASGPQAVAAAAFLQAKGLPTSPEALALALVPDWTFSEVGTLIQTLTETLAAAQKGTGEGEARRDDTLTGALREVLNRFQSQIRGLAAQLTDSSASPVGLALARDLLTDLQSLDQDMRALAAQLASLGAGVSGRTPKSGELQNRLQALLRRLTNEMQGNVRELIGLGVSPGPLEDTDLPGRKEAADHLLVTLNRFATDAGDLADELALLENPASPSTGGARPRAELNRALAGALQRLAGEGPTQDPAGLLQRAMAELGRPAAAELFRDGPEVPDRERSLAFLVSKLAQQSDAPETAKLLHRTLSAIHLHNAGEAATGQARSFLLPLPLPQGRTALLQFETWPDQKQQKTAAPLVKLKLDLALEHLGPLSVALTMVGRHVIGRIATRDTQTRDFVAARIDQLKESLSSHGYQVGRVDCTTGDAPEEKAVGPVLKKLDLKV